MPQMQPSHLQPEMSPWWRTAEGPLLHLHVLHGNAAPEGAPETQNGLGAL